jgi:hypothetical protein
MDALAAEAFLNASHKVYGLAMRPLSLGHAFVLESLGNPFYHGRLGTPEELRVAAWICANPPLCALRLGGAGNLWWRYRTRNADFEREVARWKVFVDDFCTPPQLWTKAPKAGESRAEPSRIPHQISTAVRLMRLGMSEREAWQTPVGIASWYEAAGYETESGSRLDIVTDSERVAILRQKLREQQAAASDIKGKDEGNG